MASLAPSQLGTPSSPPSTRRSRRRLFSFYGLGLVLVALGAIALFMYGFDYYRLSLLERVHHAEFRDLHPSGRLGYLYGVLGSSLLLFNLLYLVRRKVPRMRLGSMQAWLNAHVISGLGAYALIVFHSAFQQRTLLASGTFWSLTVVVATGIVGRYLKSLTPQPELERLDYNLRALDNLASGLGDEIRKIIAATPPTDIGAAPTLVRCLRTLPSWRNDTRMRRAAIQRVARLAVARDPSMALAHNEVYPALVTETVSLAVQEVRSVAATALLRTWRSLHRFLAIMMMTTVFVHIATAWSYGYRWIWSQ